MSISTIKKHIQDIVGDMNNLPIVGVVTSIKDEVCNVKISSGLELQGVRLKATVTKDKKRILMTPKVGTRVVMLTSTGSLNSLFVVQMDEVEKIEVITEELQIVIDNKIEVKKKELQLVVDEKLELKVGEVSLVDVFKELCSTIKELTVSTGMGPSGTPLPSTQVKVKKLEKDFDTIFK